MLNYMLGGAYVPPIYVTPSAPVVDGRLEVLEARLDSLELACAAMYSLLKQKHGYTDQELAEAIHTVDAADGSVDGKISKPVGICPHCGRGLLSRRANRCLWCGGMITQMPF